MGCSKKGQLHTSSRAELALVGNLNSSLTCRISVTLQIPGGVPKERR